MRAGAASNSGKQKTRFGLVPRALSPRRPVLFCALGHDDAKCRPAAELTRIGPPPPPPPPAFAKHVAGPGRVSTAPGVNYAFGPPRRERLNRGHAGGRTKRSARARPIPVPSLAQGPARPQGGENFSRQLRDRSSRAPVAFINYPSRESPKPISRWRLAAGGSELPIWARGSVCLFISFAKRRRVATKWLSAGRPNFH